MYFCATCASLLRPWGLLLTPPWPRARSRTGVCTLRRFKALYTFSVRMAVRRSLSVAKDKGC
jgi:hypothetical protein